MSMRFLTIICLSVLLFSSCGDCDENVDVAIIGGGLMGSSTAWHLSAKRVQRTFGYDQSKETDPTFA